MTDSTESVMQRGERLKRSSYECNIGMSGRRRGGQLRSGQAWDQYLISLVAYRLLPAGNHMKRGKAGFTRQTTFAILINITFSICILLFFSFPSM